MAVTKIENLINPEVMADMISAKLPSAIAVTPFARVDTTLEGRAGNTITVPKYSYIGDAVDVAEGEDVTPVVMSATDVDYKIKKAMQAVTLTDEAVLSGYGNPVGEANKQLVLAIASKIDGDAIAVLNTASQTYDGSEGIIEYDGVVKAIDVFNEELNTEKVMFVNPKQVSQLRLDPNFISGDKYTGEVVMTGEIGMIANAHIVPTRRVKEESGKYKNPIVKIETDARTEDELPALTIYTKRAVNVETERHSLSRTTDISVDEFYVAALTNDSKVVVATFAAN
jgi:N4-gp56 family major capsid protein